MMSAIGQPATDSQYEYFAKSIVSAAQAVVMLNDMQASHPQVASNPHAGNIIGLKAQEQEKIRQRH